MGLLSDWTSPRLRADLSRSELSACRVVRHSWHWRCTSAISFILTLILLFGQSEEDEIDALLLLTDKIVLLVMFYSYISGLYGYINKVKPTISRQLFGILCFRSKSVIFKEHSKLNPYTPIYEVWANWKCLLITTTTENYIKRMNEKELWKYYWIKLNLVMYYMSFSVMITYHIINLTWIILILFD